jgi:hypothetical protein
MNKSRDTELGRRLNGRPRNVTACSYYKVGLEFFDYLLSFGHRRQRMPSGFYILKRKLTGKARHLNKIYFITKLGHQRAFDTALCSDKHNFGIGNALFYRFGNI